MISRRAVVLSASAALPLSLPLPAVASVVGVDLAPGSGDQTAAFQAGLDKATAEKRPFVLAPGTYRIGAVRLPDGAQIVGTAGLTTLVAVDDGLALTGGPAKRIVLSGLGFRKEEWTKRTEEFSGGWQMRIALARLLQIGRAHV